MSHMRLALSATIVMTIGAAAARGQTCPGASSPTDYCAMATEIDGSIGHHVVYMDVSTATYYPGEMQVYTTAGHVVWFSVYVQSSGNMTITTCLPYTKYDTVMEVYQGGESNCEFMTLIGYNDDTPSAECNNGCSSYGSTVEF